MAMDLPMRHQHQLQLAALLASQAAQGFISENVEDGVSLYVNLFYIMCVCLGRGGEGQRKWWMFGGGGKDGGGGIVTLCAVCTNVCFLWKMA